MKKLYMKCNITVIEGQVSDVRYQEKIEEQITDVRCQMSGKDWSEGQN